MIEPLQEPVAVFLTIMAVILVTPLLMERAHLPGIVGLILGGILVGPHGLGLLGANPTIELLSTVGLIYLMFSAGLEIDLHQFGRVRNRALAFGLCTFCVPLASGLAMGRLLGLAWPAAVLLGSVYASHTLVSFPILSRLGIVRNEAVSVTIGATVFTDVAALLVLAVIAGAQGGAGTTASVLRLVALMVGYAALVLLGLPPAGKAFFRRFTSRAIEFQFVLVALFVAALLAEGIGMHAIVGAFLAGLAINSALPSHSAVVGQVLFVGESFFIPIFLMFIGMITDLPAIVASPMSLLIGLVMTVCVYATKFVGAWSASRILRYSRDEMMTMWGLSQAQAAATLATVLVGTEIGLFPEEVFNGTIMMILATTITSPLLVQRFGSRLQTADLPAPERALCDRILVPIANPATHEHLLTLAAILARAHGGMLFPLHVTRANGHAGAGMEHQRRLLEEVPHILEDPEVETRPLRRVDASIARGIIHAAVENEASLIVLGWRGKPTLRQSIFGTVLDEVVWHATVPVLVGRLTAPINAMRRVILVVPEGSLRASLVDRTVAMGQTLAQAINVPLLVLAANRYLPDLRERLAQFELEYPCKVEACGQDVTRDVAARAGDLDLIVVTTVGSRRRFRASLGDVPESLAAAAPGSLVVIHFR